MTVFIYVEGGGEQRFTLSACREGFATLFAKLVPPGKLPRVIACGSRNAAFDSFKTRVSQRKAGDDALLLVDSEAGVVGGTGVWGHVLGRDHWVQPPGTSDDDLHLMVQCSEAWLIADPTTLDAFYGAGFRRTALPANPDVEQVAKADVLDGLSRATKTSRRGEYHKTGHGYELLGRLDPGAVRARSSHAERFFTTLPRVV